MPNLKFLVVEDDLFYQTYVKDLLAESGAQVINALDGEAGLAVAVAEQPDLIITAIEIPKVHGFALFKNLRERSETRDIPVIMMSGKVQKPLLERHSRLDIHANGYLVKPFSGQVLIEMIRGLMGEDSGFSEVVFEEDGQEPESQQGEQETEAAQVIPQKQVQTPAAERVNGELTVLVVDDSQYICDVARDFLEEMGAKVETAFDGESGYKLASNLLPDLILLDVQMPDLNGFVVCEMLRKQEETKNIPIIIMSAVIDEDSFRKRSRLTYHADAYMQKPFMKSELHQIVRRLTSGKESPAGSVESKAGYLVPTEEALDSDSAGSPRTQDHFEEMERIRTELRETVSREENLYRDLETNRTEKDRLERELFNLRKSAQDTEEALKDKLTLLTQRLDEARVTSEKLAEENRSLVSRVEGETALLERSQDLERELENLRAAGSQDGFGGGETGEKQGLCDEIDALKRDLTAALAAKSEIEDQAKMLKERRDQEDALLKGSLAKAHESIEVLERENEELTASAGELDACRSRNIELEKINEDLIREKEAGGKRADDEARLRKDLDAKLAEVSEEKTLLEDDARKAAQRVEELEEQGRQLGELEDRLRREIDLRVLSEKEADDLRVQLKTSKVEGNDFRKLEEENRQLREALESGRKPVDGPVGEIRGSEPGRTAENTRGAVVAGDIEDRLSQLENTLSKTVVEAQNIVRKQQERESTLEGNIASLMSSLEEERSMYRKEREAWTSREAELRDAFEGVIRENRRFASEREDRFYPIHIPSRNRPLKVVGRKSRYVYVVVAVILFLLAAGFFAASMVRSRSERAAVPDRSQLGNAYHKSSENGAISKPFSSETDSQGKYEELWRRNTAQSVSDDMMIQATFHTHEELVAAIRYRAEKEGWNGERTRNTLADMEKTYNLPNFYYVTVYSKNLKGGYPGYADNFASHLVLRDQIGNEVEGRVPVDLQKNRFITSRVSSIGKEMNPDFLYEVGMTVAFPRAGLTADPGSLQLVLYDIGALPVRVLRWDMSRMESRSVR